MPSLLLLTVSLEGGYPLGNSSCALFNPSLGGRHGHSPAVYLPYETVKRTTSYAELCFRIRENLDNDVMARFSPLTLAHEPDGGTTLIGPVRNLVELRRMLLKIRDLKLTLLSVIKQ